MDKNTTIAGPETNNGGTGHSKVILIASLSGGLSLIAVMIFIVIMTYLKKNKGAKKTKELKRLRSILSKPYLKRDSNLSSFSLKINSNMVSECSKKIDNEMDKSGLIEFKTINVPTETNQVNLSSNNIIQVKRNNNYITDSEKKMNSSDITTSTFAPLQSRFAPKETNDNIFLTKLGTNCDFDSKTSNQRVIQYNEDFKNTGGLKKVKK